MKISIIVIKFLFIGALFIVSNQNLALTDVENREIFYDSFVDWLGSLWQHTLQITGYVINSGWLPGENSSGPFDNTFSFT